MRCLTNAALFCKRSSGVGVTITGASCALAKKRSKGNSATDSRKGTEGKRERKKTSKGRRLPTEANARHIYKELRGLGGYDQVV